MKQKAALAVATLHGSAVETPLLRQPPHNIEAEQALLGAIFINNEAIDRVSAFLEPRHFFDPLHAQIFETAAKLIQAGKSATPITLKTYFENAEPIDTHLTVPQYLVRLAANATTVYNAHDYGRAIYDLATRRSLIIVGEDMVNAAYDSPVDFPPKTQIEEAESRLYELAEAGRYGQGFQTFGHALTNAIEMANNAYKRAGHLSGLATGLADLDNKMGGLQSSDLIILAGRPSMGKTAISTNIAYNIAKNYRAERQPDGTEKVLDGAKVGFFSLEMSAEQLATRILSEQAEIPSEKIRRGMIDETDFRKLVQVSQEMSQIPLYIDQTGGITVAQLAARARKLKRQHGLGLLVVDYLQLLAGSSKSRSDGRVQEVTEITTGLKALAKELNVPVVALSQLSRQVEQRDDKRPQLSDLRESGCLSGETLITLADSGARVPIRELEGKSGFTIWALNDQTLKIEPAKVSRAFRTGRKPVYKMTTRLGRLIRATANHKFRAIGEWKRLDELKVRDRIALPRAMNCGASNAMSPSEAALLGHLIGDGCTLPRHAIQYTTRELDLADIVEGLTRQVFGDRIRPRVKRERQWYQVYLSASENLTHGKRNPVAAWLDDLGAFGLRSYQKRVPDILFEQSAETIATFLRHLWATDGCVLAPVGNVTRYPAIYYATSSEVLARDVQCLLLRLGINAVLRPRSQGVKGRTQYHVMIMGRDDVVRFADLVGAAGAYKSAAIMECRRLVEKTVGNTNRDVIPRTIWREIVVPAMAVNGVTTRRLQAALGQSYCGTGLYKQNLGRARAARVAAIVGHDPQMSALAASDVYWDEIVSIEPDGEDDVFDLTVAGPHNFVANDIIAHNSIEQDADVVMFVFREEYYVERKKPSEGHFEDMQKWQQEMAQVHGKAEVIIGKQRHGPTGTVQLSFEAQFTRFGNLARDAYMPERME